MDVLVNVALFRGSGGDVTGMEFQRGVGGIYGHPNTGTAPYCTVTADHGTHYGGFNRVGWQNAAVEVFVLGRSSFELGLPDDRVVLTLDLTSDDIERVRAGLRRVFAGGDFDYAQPELVGFGPNGT